MYFEPTTGRIFDDHSAIRSGLPNVIFGKSIDDEALAYVGIYPVEQVPSGAAPDQTAVRGEPEFVDGVWRQTWTLRAATADELAARAPVVPQVVPMLNARLAMIEAGWMADVKAYLASLTGIEGEQAREFFEFALTMRRDHALVEGFRVATRKTHEEVDKLFLAAGALNV